MSEPTIQFCNVCYKPQHAETEIFGQKFTLCVEMPKDKIIGLPKGERRCGCCKCANLEFPEESPILTESD